MVSSHRGDIGYLPYIGIHTHDAAVSDNQNIGFIGAVHVDMRSVSAGKYSDGKERKSEFSLLFYEVLVTIKALTVDFC